MTIKQLLFVLLTHAAWEMYGMLITEVDGNWIYPAGIWLGLLTFVLYAFEFNKE